MLGIQKTVFLTQNTGFYIFCVSLFLSLPPLWGMGGPGQINQHKLMFQLFAST